MTKHTFENVRSYAEYLGAFWMAFNGLELMIRIYLARRSGVGTSQLMQLLNPTQGDTLPETPLTDWSMFRSLCTRFNESVPNSFKIDFDDIVALRDAMAHGRVSGDNSGLMIVTKYSKPQSGKVNVEYKQVLTLEFLDTITAKMHQHTQSVSQQISPYMKP
jgi:hypothetical protein